jgi:diguanylate cyclase (GGDEF)-like protein
VSFGRRLALFFGLIAGIPALVLVLVLLLASESAQRGKADARLAAGARTATVLYGQDVQRARGPATAAASDPSLKPALLAADRAALEQIASRLATGPVVGVQIVTTDGRTLASAGSGDAVAPASVSLTDGGRRIGVLRVSTTSARSFLGQVKSLTGREAVLQRDGAPSAGTIQASSGSIQPGETTDLSAGGNEYRAHLLALGPGESLLLLGPKDAGTAAIGTGTWVVLALFLLVALSLAWLLARRLTRLHDRVAAQAVTDPLTGLFNRRFLTETLEREVDRALRFGHPISLVILDIDDFKRINDDLGHLRGDDVLEGVAEAMHAATRSIDVAARYGGDELALILLETDRAGAAVVAERIRESVSSADFAAFHGIPDVTISVGVATIPGQADDMTSLINAADGALLRAKRAGKNMIRTAPRGARFEPDEAGQPGARARGDAGIK